VLCGGMDNFALLAIPIFILLSAPIAEFHTGKDLYETVYKWLYKIPGGLGVANMVGFGLVTPSVGLNLYVVKNIAPDVPKLALWLPNKMIG
jgi:TRAP-type C4-dicarboxylate transport system permease large subunit